MVLLSIMDIIYVPLAYIMKLLFWLIGDYGWSILAFALLTRLLMLPMGIKSEQGRLKMNQFQPKIRKLDEKYHGDKKNPKYQEELQALYSQEGYNPISGCLPQLIQLPLIFGLWNAIRRPLTYVCDFSEQLLYDVVNKINSSSVTSDIVEHLRGLFANAGDASAIVKTAQANEIYVAQAINENANTIDGLKELIQGHTMINTQFMGINLGATASAEKGWFLLIPAIAAISSFLVSFVSMRINRNNSIGDKGDPTAKSMNAMMYTMPLLSLWIGYSMNFGVALYWISTNLLSLVQTIVLSRFIRPKKDEDGNEKKKEKKLNYTQLEKMKREESLLNGEPESGKKEEK